MIQELLYPMGSNQDKNWHQGTEKVFKMMLEKLYPPIKIDHGPYAGLIKFKLINFVKFRVDFINLKIRLIVV